MALALSAALAWVALAGCISQSPPSRYQAEARDRLSAGIAGQPQAELLTSLTNVPSSIREWLGPLSDAGGPFAPDCVSVNGQPHDRFLVATRSRETFIVAVEHGGFVYGWDLTRFVLDQHGQIVSAQRLASDGTVVEDPARRPDR